MTSSPVLDRHGPGPGQPGAGGTVFVAEKKARRGRRPRALTAAATLIAAVLALPLVFLLIEASGSGAAADWRLIARPLTGELLWNTVRLTVVVTALCAVIGTAAAWCVERTNVPGRKIWAVLVVVPLAIPDFVVSFGWASLWTWIHGFRGAVIVMTLAVYPLVYLPVAASLRGADPGQEEVARSLGSGRVRTFVRITLGQARGAILGGCLLVAMVMLAEYGAFEIVGYQTFTTEIFTEINVAFSLPAACALALVLVLLSLIVLGAEGRLRGRGRVSRSGALAQRVSAPQRLGKARIPALAGLDRAGRAVPRRPGRRPACTGWPRAAGTRSPACRCRWRRSPPRCTGCCPRGWPRCWRCPSRCSRCATPAGPAGSWSAAPTWCWRVPGVVIALALSYFTERYLGGFGYQTAPLLILAYAIMFFPLALVGVKASLARRPGQPGRGGPLPRPAPAGGALPGHAAADRAGPGRRVLPGLPLGYHRADRHPYPDPDRRADPGLAVLGVRDEPVLRAGRPVRPGDDRRGGRPELGARPVLRSRARRPEDDDMTQLAVAGLDKRFGAHQVLADLSLDVPAGSLTAILGPSGSGKTTLLRVLAGFEHADAGTVTDRLRDGRRAGPCSSPERRRIGYVPQEGSLFPHLTVAANVAFGLSRRTWGRDRRARRCAELLEAVGLGGLDRRYPHQLSGGQQQRVALARALAIAPEVVLLDEPFASLDANLRASVRADVQQLLKESGTTTVLVTHDQDEALSTADRVAVLRDGGIAQCAAPQELYCRPVDADMARFIGEANLIPGVLSRHVRADGAGPARRDRARSRGGRRRARRPRAATAAAARGTGRPWC